MEEPRDDSKARSAYTTLTLDLERYLGQIEDWDMSPSQKAQFIEALWGLLVSFAELGFQIAPVQQAAKTGRKRASKPGGKSPEKSAKTPDKSSVLRADMLSLSPIHRTQIKSGSEGGKASESNKGLSHE